MIKNISSKFTILINKAKQYLPLFTHNVNNQVNKIFMSKEEALKILNFTNVENINTLSKEQITSRADKYIEMNNPAKGGSFYIQNKVLYAKETLLAYYNMNNNKPITKKEYKH